MTRARLAPDDRREQLVAAAVAVAAEAGVWAVTSTKIARAVGCSASLVRAYWPARAGLRNAIMVRAVRDRVLPVIAQGLLAGDPVALGADEQTRRDALSLGGV